MDFGEKIQSIILSNTMPPGKRRVGIEVECLFYDKNFKRIPVNTDGDYSAKDLLRDILKETVNSSYSLEPGGQLEWASAPLLGLHELDKAFQRQKDKQISLGHEMDLMLLDLSLEPLYTPEDIDLIDQQKYRLMHRRFKQSGTLGPWMMRNTTSIQINLDLASKEDAEEMAYLADVFQPFSSLLFANCPFMGGLPTGKRNVRYEIWKNTDPSRCGTLMEHGISSPNNLLEKFAEMALKAPAIFVNGPEGQALEFKGSLGEYLRSKESVGREDVLSVLHQIFTHVRFKQVLEIRGPDRPPGGYELAPAAFWLGLLTGEKIRDKARELADRFTIKDRELLNAQASVLDLNQRGPQGKSLRDWMEIVCQLSLDGLEERSRWMGLENESVFLTPFLDNYFEKGFMSLQIQEAFHNSGQSLTNFLRTRCEETLDWY